MTIFREILKSILIVLAKNATKKHRIKFIVVVGWFGSDLVKEGIYQSLSEKFNTRRNIKKVWWDLSVPLDILGYEDKQYKFFQWLVLFFRTIFSLILNKSNPHTFILSLNLTQKSIAEYWYRIVDPAILVVTSYKERRGYLVDALIRKTKEVNGIVLMSDQITQKKFENFQKFGFRTGKNPEIFTASNKYPVNKDFPPLFLKIYSPVISVLETLDIEKQEIVHALAKTCAEKNLVSKIIQKVREE